MIGPTLFVFVRLVIGVLAEDASPRCLRQQIVVDGDTVKCGPLSIRLAKFDTPEIFKPRCMSEYRRGLVAACVASREIGEACGLLGFCVRIGRGDGGYGRKQGGVVLSDGSSLGATLMKYGLAKETSTDTGRFDWCSDVAINEEPNPSLKKLHPEFFKFLGTRPEERPQSNFTDAKKEVRKELLSLELAENKHREIEYNCPMLQTTPRESETQTDRDAEASGAAPA